MSVSTPTSTSEIYTLSLHDALPILIGIGCAELVDGDAARDDLFADGETRALQGEKAMDQIRARFGSAAVISGRRSEEHTSELQSHLNLVCRLLLEKKNKQEMSTSLL